jgi:hypothetical protein
MLFYLFIYLFAHLGLRDERVKVLKYLQKENMFQRRSRQSACVSPGTSPATEIADLDVASQSLLELETASSRIALGRPRMA